MITINLDFVRGNELSYMEGLGKDNFETNCLDFFSFETKTDDVVVVRSDNTYVSRNELLYDNKFTDKEIRESHNIHKMLVAGVFEFRNRETEPSSTYLLNKLNEMKRVIPDGQFRYEFRKSSNSHIVEVTPFDIFNDADYINYEISIEKDFNDKFPNNEIIFTNPDIRPFG